MQGSDPDVIQDYIDFYGMKYPIAERGSVDGSMGGALPMVVVVFDHKGEMILHKRRFDARTRETILKALEKAPHPLLGDRKYTKLVKEAEMVKRGENLGRVLSKVREIREDEDADLALFGEANALYSRLDDLAEDLLLDAELAAENNPVLGVRGYRTVLEMFSEDTAGEQARVAMAAIKGSETYSREEAAWKAWEEVAGLHAMHRLRISRINRVMLEKVDRILEGYAGTVGGRVASRLKPKIVEALKRYTLPEDAASLAPPVLRAESTDEKSVIDFKYTRLDGKECSLSDHRGKVVVIDFFSSGWLMSRNNIVHMERIHRRYKDKGVVVLGLGRDDPDALKAFHDTRSEDMTYIVGRSADAARVLRAGYIPHVFIIDPEGRLYWHGEPKRRPKRLEKFWHAIDAVMGSGL